MTTRMLPLLGLALAAACTDFPTAPASGTSHRTPAVASAHSGRLGKYVAMGTSLSQGVMSNGVVGSDQAQSWTSQLADLAETPFSLPLISEAGCQPPLAAPLASLRRVNGENALVRSAVCSPLVAGIATPTQNLALSEATTFNALGTTPENAPTATWPLKGEFYSRVLGPGQTQLTAMLAQQPDFVSVDFGINEVLGVRHGLLAPMVTYVPTAVWRPAYDQLIAGVRSSGAKVLLVGLISDVSNFPSFRTGEELYANRSELAEFGIQVSEDCGASASRNYIYVAGKVIGAYAMSQAATAAGTVAPEMSCADVPGSPDHVLTPADIALIEAQVIEMTAYIRQTAEANGWAFMDLDVLFARPDLKAPFSARTLLLSDEPYGPFISLDGVHPAAPGHALIAREAAKILNTTYHLGIRRSRSPALF